MYKVHLTSKDVGYHEFSFELFKDDFLEICSAHQKENKALCFAFILFRERDAHIVDVLSKRSYWEAYDEISGDYLSVFSFEKKEDSDPVKKRSRRNEFKMMNSVIRGESYRSAAEDMVKEHFKFNQPVKYPAILFFQVIDNQIISPFLVPLRVKETEGSFLEIKWIMENAEETLKRITPENKKNHQEIINLVRGNIESDLDIETLQGTVKRIGVIVKLLKPLFKLVGFHGFI